MTIPIIKRLLLKNSLTKLKKRKANQKMTSPRFLTKKKKKIVLQRLSSRTLLLTNISKRKSLL